MQIVEKFLKVYAYTKKKNFSKLIWSYAKEYLFL